MAHGHQEEYMNKMETLSAKEREVQQSQDMKEQLFTESQSMMDDLKDQN